jgi:type IV secretion system protein VirB9
MTRVNNSIPITLTACLLLSACASYTPPEIDYDSEVPSLPASPPAVVEEPIRAIHTPPPWTPSRGGDADAATAEARVINANAAARVEPRREGYYNAIQVFPYSEGALYQIYAAPGQITNIALEPGEQLTGAGPIAAGDTTRWIIGDTESGTGRTTRVHVLVKPTRPSISTNLVINTDRRTYLLELRANEESYMPSVAWSYPPGRVQPRPPAIQQPAIPPTSQRNYRYGLQVGATPRPGGRTASSTMAVAFMSSFRAASCRARCHPSSCLGPMAAQNSSTPA